MDGWIYVGFMLDVRMDICWIYEYKEDADGVEIKLN